MLKRFAVILSVLCGCAVGLQAETIPTDANCKVALVAYLNGTLQISMTGSTALTLKRCEVQFRPHGVADADWSASQTVSFSLLGPGGTDNKLGQYCSCAVTLSQNTDVRFRAFDGNDDSANSTEWITQEDVRVEPYPLTPANYTKTDTARNPTGGSGLAILKNGKQNEVAELDPSKSEWLQFDLGSVKAVAGLRVLPRLAWAGRLANAKIEVSDAEDMTGAQTMIALTPAYGTSTTAADWAFPETVQCRYIRVTATSGWIDITEAEPYSDRPDVSNFAVAVQQNAYNDAQPSISLTASWGMVESWTIERAFSSVGPWDEVATGDAPPAEGVVDGVPRTPSVTYCYRARFTCRLKNGGTGDVTPPVATYLYGRCLERVWTNPTQLFSGVSVLTDCQVNPTYPTARAFDGNIDGNIVATTDNPLIGLDLAKACHLTLALVRSRTSNYGINTPISLWGANVMPVNTPTRQEEDDPNYTELSRNTEPGGGNGGYFGHWYRFPVMDTVSTFRYAFIHKNAPDAAASNWGNVLEVTFYGYDDDDVTAAQVIAPEVFTATRTADGVRLAWTRGYNVGTLSLERRAGDGEWTEVVAQAADAGSWTDPAEGLQDCTLYSYRLKATQGAEVRFSTTSVFWYATGSGTGLLATYSAPSPLDSCNPDEVRLGSETVSCIVVAKASGEAVYGATADNVLVAWKGRLIVPVDGSYTFTAEASDGFMLELDGDVNILPSKLQDSSPDTSICSVLNDWKSTDGKVTARVRTGYTLTAGEHQIRAWWNPTTGAKACALKWTLPGATVSETIPVTQFVPASEPDPETYGKDGWRFRSVSNTRGYIVQNGEDMFAISEADTQANSFSHGSFAWKKIASRNFIFEADLFAPQMFNEFGCLFVSANLNGGMTGDGAVVMPYRRARKDGVNVRIRTTDKGANANLLSQYLYVSVPGSTSQENNNDWCWLRIERDGDLFTVKARHGTTKAGGVREDCPWVTVGTYNDTDHRFGEEVYVGFGSTTTAEPSRIYQAKYAFSNVKVRDRKGLVLIVR